MPMPMGNVILLSLLHRQIGLFLWKYVQTTISLSMKGYVICEYIISYTLDNYIHITAESQYGHS